LTTPDSIPPLPPELDELLGAARPLDAAPMDARERLARRVALSAAVSVAAAGTVAGAAANAGESTLTLKSAAVKTLWSPLAQKIAIGLASFALGGGVGAAVQSSLAPAPVAVHAAAPASQAAAAEPARAPAAAAPSDIPTVAIGDLPAAPPSARPRAASPSASASVSAAAGLADERRLLDGARAALSRGEPSQALGPLDEHTRRFPHGVLTEEREALAIQALARSGRTTEAADRASRFDKTYPTSLMMPAVKDALGAARDRP
jgi:hypothetical protein